MRSYPIPIWKSPLTLLEVTLTYILPTIMHRFIVVVWIKSVFVSDNFCHFHFLIWAQEFRNFDLSSKQFWLAIDRLTWLWLVEKFLAVEVFRSRHSQKIFLAVEVFWSRHSQKKLLAVEVFWVTKKWLWKKWNLILAVESVRTGPNLWSYPGQSCWHW